MTFTPENFNIWFELPVTDLDKAIGFYEAVFQTKLVKEDMEPNPVAFFPTAEMKGRGGHLYPGKPAAKGTGMTIHLPCPDTLEATMDRLVEAGGEVVSDPIQIPYGRFTYCLDPDGNSISLYTA
ncbi:VOC family protein [Roseibium sp.]|uniref:VOC family protein n=1 Tax=Roseibium sp. TaxID=1936156 RepID=UPI003A987C4A